VPFCAASVPGNGRSWVSTMCEEIGRRKLAQDMVIGIRGDRQKVHSHNAVVSGEARVLQAEAAKDPLSSTGPEGRPSGTRKQDWLPNQSCWSDIARSERGYSSAARPASIKALV
jgi:hypothetical protein